MLLKHVNDLLEMSRIEAKKLKIDLKPVDVAAMVRFVASHFDVLAIERGIEYTIEVPDPCVAMVDPDKAQRVVMNLLANAFKFVPNDGRVRCALTCTDDRIVITVDDSGPGVKPELRDAIFERFRQAEGGIDRTAGGTGLGLAIAKEFVDMHQGAISVHDSSLGGARFVVELPLHHVEDGDGLRIAPESVANRDTLQGLIEELRPGIVAPVGGDNGSDTHGRARVLVVEDNAEMNRFICDSLSRDYEVIPAFNGSDGLEKALEFAPTLVVSDIMMPGVSGVEMFEEMQKLPELKSLPVLFLSAKADEQLRVKLLEEGAHDFIVKPFSENDLKVRVRNVIRELEALRDAEQARGDAERANLAKSEFLASMSHELRTPLNAIQGHVQLLEMGLHGPVTDEQKQALGRVQRNQQALQSLINDVLNFAKLEAGRVEFHVEPVDVLETVTTVVQMVDAQLAIKGLESTVNIPEGIRVVADPDKLRQVLLNLLSNAIKFTDAGGLISIDAPHRDGVPENLVMLRVSDTGRGIPRDKQDDIFDPFVQVHRQTFSAAGIGLGLAISRDLARGMGGELRVRSEEGRGSVFTLTLPRA
jgi:signal transduction histidine kinase